MYVISLTEDTRIQESDNIVEFYIKPNSKDFLKIKNLCDKNTPLNIIFIWENYKNIKYGINLEDFNMENCSFTIGHFSTFYGRCKKFKRLNECEYNIIHRKIKINEILNEPITY